MLFKLFLILAAVSTSSITEASYGQNNTPCPCGWQKISNGCYLFVKHKVTWDVARANCLKQGGDLVIPRNAWQCVWLSNRGAILGMQVPWIGIFRRRLDGKFYNTCGKPVSYTRWNSGEPNDAGGHENCGHMYTHGTGKAKWNDINCNSRWGYICEIKLPRCD